MLLIDFFKTLKRSAPRLFWLLGIAFFLQIAFTLIKLEVTPFLLYGMYSEKIPAQTVFAVREIEADGISLNEMGMSAWQKDILYTGYENFRAMLQNNNTDPVQTRVEQTLGSVTRTTIYSNMKKSIFNDTADMNEFAGWFRRTLSRFSNRTIHQIEVYSSELIFDRSAFTVQKKRGNLFARF